MKKVVLFLMALVVCNSLMSTEMVAYAAESGMTVVPEGEIRIEKISQSDMAMLQQEISQGVIDEDVCLPQGTNATYEPYRYTNGFNFYLDGTWVARADIECVVWHYTDGKVHLYSRTITVTRLATYDASRTYGRIVNTDGSLSYTTGDRVHLYGDMATWNFAIDFRVTPTEASFDCYEV